MSTWLARVLTEEPGFEAQLVARYSERLLGLARRQLPGCIRSRVDPEDVVQSVYRSFFHRLHQGQFAFEESHDLWRLLAAMTYRKASNVVKFHLRERRDSRREQPLAPGQDLEERTEAEAGAADLELLVGCLEQLLGALSETRREIVVRRLEGEPIQDIARRVGCSRRTVHRVLTQVQEVAARMVEASS
jgi:RNA polymerase sigma-70 factor (ECF subfamily)